MRSARAAAPSGETADAASVPSGISFHASLDAPLSSSDLKAGDRFTASLGEPLIAGDGTMVAPKGAKLNGRVLDVDREGVNRLVVQFDTLEVRGRNHPIYAQVIRLDSARVLPTDAMDPASLATSVYPMLPMTLPVPAAGGGPSPEHVPLIVPAGAQLQLYLLRAFAPTGDGTAM